MLITTSATKFRRGARAIFRGFEIADGCMGSGQAIDMIYDKDLNAFKCVPSNDTKSYVICDKWGMLSSAVVTVVFLDGALLLEIDDGEIVIPDGDTYVMYDSDGGVTPMSESDIAKVHWSSFERLYSVIETLITAMTEQNYRVIDHYMDNCFFSILVRNNEGLYIKLLEVNDSFSGDIKYRKAPQKLGVDPRKVEVDLDADYVDVEEYPENDESDSDDFDLDMI